ncbi:MAG TPA: translation elongation factor 4 [Aggregatilineales bacterium]|nr:translation elongation factor 4 [Aggregatilineales bacterium]
MNRQNIRNFSIIAHVDHGKSTLADRLLQLTQTVQDRDMHAQLLDSMDLERERGVTIKASAVRMHYTYKGEEYIINLIDTPGHVDFTYEVSRALQACEGALLVVDASQGIEAQTLTNVYLALGLDLEIIPVINKIDLPSARPDEIAQEVEDLLGLPAEDMIRISAKNGIGITDVLHQLIEKVPAPRGDLEKPLRALVFDSHYDAYKGVIAYVRVVDGSVKKNDLLKMMANSAKFEPIEIGIFNPAMRPIESLGAGETGYIATGLKTVRECRVGDTVTLFNNPAETALPGYQQVKPMVFAGVYPTDNDAYGELKDALEKLQLNDASLVYESESSQALNFGFRVGFLGLFHMEIIQERLEREYDLDILVTAPSVEYEVTKRNGEVIRIDSPVDLPDESTIEEIREPWMEIQIYTPQDYIGVIMDLTLKKRGTYVTSEYLDATRVILHFMMPLSELIVDYYDKLKSASRGYASLDYSFKEYRSGDLVKMDVLVNGEPLDALSIIVHKDHAYHKGQRLVTKLKELIPRQMFVIPIQAAVGSKIISRANISAVRKDVLAKCYGGDITRKKKLLEKQKKGKKRMKMVGAVEVPQEAFMSLLSLDED